MPIGLDEFKKRFGKKPVDAVKPEDRYKALLTQNGPKIRAGLQRGEQAAVDIYAALNQYTAKQDWHAAADLLDDIAPKLAVDTKQATKLRKDLATQAQRAFLNGKLVPALKGAHDAIEAAIVADDYDDASSQLDDFKDLVDDHLAKCDMWETRVEEVDAKAELVEARQRAGGYATPELTKAKQELGAAQSKLRNALLPRDFATADVASKQITLLLDTLLAQPADTSLPALKQLYEKRRAALKADLDYWLPFVGSPDALLASHLAALGTLKTNVETADRLFGEDKYQEALDGLDPVIGEIAALRDAVKAQHDQLVGTIAAFSKTVADAIRGNKVPPTVPHDLDTAALLKANKDRAIAQQGKDYVKAIRMFMSYAAGFRTIWQEIQNQPPVQAPVSPKAAQYQQLIQNPDRDALTTALNAPDADLAAFRAQPGGPKLLDDMVKAIGGKADTKEKRAFVQAAMKARFGLKEVSGGADGKGMSTKALPRMYQLFAMLPAEHTTDNDLITSVERLKENDTSTHSSTTKKIVLKAGKTGKTGGNFDDTTLHEIAHGVDSKFGFMETNGKSRTFGGWRSETRESVKKVAAEDLDFYGYFEKKAVPRALLEQYLDLALSGGNPKTLQAQFTAAKDPQLVSLAELKKHPAIKHAADGQNAAKDDDDKKRDLTFAARKLIKDKEPVKSMVSTIVEAVAFGKSADEAINALLGSLNFAGQAPPDAVWSEMAVHPAIDFATNVGLKNGTSGLWDQSDAGAARYAVNGRVYQQAYTSDWVSYLLSARSAKVCDYQFRHRMEWFAECYSRFFLNTLSPSHPLVPWLTQQKAGVQPGT